jgi:hypothetical protein
VKRGHIVLISGAVLFAVGIALTTVWGTQFAGMFLQDNTLINEVSIDPGQSIESTRQVTDISRPLTVAIHIQGINQDDTLPLRNDVRLVETVRDPSGAIISRNEFSGNLFTSFKPEQIGNHILTITNNGTRSVTIDGTFGYMPFINMEGGQQVDFDFGHLSGVISGSVLTAIGLFTIIAGIVIVIVDGRKKGDSTATSDGGITYKKD